MKFESKIWLAIAVLVLLAGFFPSVQAQGILAAPDLASATEAGGETGPEDQIRSLAFWVRDQILCATGRDEYCPCEFQEADPTHALLDEAA